MLKRDSRSFCEIREYLDTVPVIESHEHQVGIHSPVENVLAFILENYYMSDFESGSMAADAAMKLIYDRSVPFEQRYERFAEIYAKSNMTSYARAMEQGLKLSWGIDKIDLPSLKKLEKDIAGRSQSFCDQLLEKHQIKAMIVDTDIDPYVSGQSGQYSEKCRFAFPLPKYHNIHSVNDLQPIERQTGRKINTLADYLEGFEQYLKKCIDFGVVCMKDQTAYRRIIHYENPARADAERVFNQIISRPRDIFGDDQVRVLDDWLFHHFMQLAGKYKLPVQLHTGHMAGIRNDIAKTNAVHLTNVLEMYPEVQFDLFHGNWPYMGELLFLGKNYPNVFIDLCWVQTVDPLYSVELMKRALVTVPHTKIMAFGGDTIRPEWTVGYLDQARDNTAYALSEMLDSGWLSLSEAKRIAEDWFFNNPNSLFRLGL
jgi:uncharacterized protein